MVGGGTSGRACQGCLGPVPGCRTGGPCPTTCSSAHRTPAVVVQAGFTERDRWIAVDPSSFATRFPAVYAIGDITSAPVPRAGTIAEGEASTLADVLIATVRGAVPPSTYSDKAVCCIEAGSGTVAKVDVNFLSGTTLTAVFAALSVEHAEHKRESGAFRASLWFGVG